METKNNPEVKPEDRAAQIPVDTIVSQLLPCPCGEIPEDLHITTDGRSSKWAYASGACCGEWSVEFRTDYHGHETDECMKLAIEEWNRSVRMANAVNLDDVIAVLINTGYLIGPDVVDKIKPFHGNCCCCQHCGQNNEECVCEHNDLLRAIRTIPILEGPDRAGALRLPSLLRTVRDSFPSHGSSISKAALMGQPDCN